jgi:EmrB/QacA subfamily drug resistance transporter
LWGLFSVGFSITILSIAIPTIAEEFDSSRNLLIWVITGPLLLGAIVTPAAGKLADLFGARRVYLQSMLMVAVFAALAAGAWSAGSLIAFRIIGAAIGSATGPASIAIINRLFPREQRARALGYWALVGAGGPVLGVIVGGPVVQAVSWRWIFVAQVPLSLATVALCAAVFPDTPRNRNVRFDLAGATLLGAGSASVVLALNRAPEPGWGWTHPLVLAGFVLGPALIVAFAWHERRVDNQLIPIRYFRRRNFGLPIANQFFTNFAYMGGFFITPLLLRDVLEYPEAKIGFISIARPLLFAVAGPIAGALATRVGERVNGVVGGFFLLASMLVFSQVTDSSTELWIIGALVLSGVGMGTTAPAMSAALANSVDEEDLGVAGGAQQMIASLGIVVGTQIMVTVQQANAATGVTDSYELAFLVGAAAAVLGILCASFVRPTTTRSAPGPSASTDQHESAAGRSQGDRAAAPSYVEAS